jgi:DNA-binding response OmpR family regulator
LATILALDKDPLQLELLTVLLKRDRHMPISTADPDNAIALLQNENVDLVILETAFPRHDGYRLCQQIRRDREEMPIIILSERTGDEQIVRGLLSGADDYITKPYSPRELLARIHAVMRRTEPALGHPSSAGNLRIGELTLNLQQMQLLVNGRDVGLTPRELALVNALMTNPNRVLSRDQLMRIAWGNVFVGLKTVDVCVQRLRKKVAPHLQHGAYIHAARGLGYRFESPIVEPGLMRSRRATMKLLPTLENGASPQIERPDVRSIPIIQRASQAASR